MKSPIALLRKRLNDSKRLNPGVKGLDRDFKTIEKRFENEGLGFLTKALPALDESLLLGLATGQFTCPIGFKTAKWRTIPKFLSGMFCEVFDPFTGILKETPDMGILKCLHGILKLFKKTQVSAEDEEFLHQKAVNEFYQCDERASRVSIPDRHDHLIGRVCKLLLYTLNSKDTEYGKYKHGPGAVYEGYKANEKYSALFEAVWRDSDVLSGCGLWGIGENLSPGEYTPPVWRARKSPKGDRQVLEQVVRQSPPDGKGGSASPTECRIFPTSEGSWPVGLGSPRSNRASRSSARLISVAKNSTSRRTITVEPMLNQFVQQGLNILLRDSISECKILRNSIALTDQSLNQVQALEGSLYDNWATIDLKSASDLLSVSLVRSVFRHNPRFLEDMMDCRSTEVECKELTVTLGKFAGMGNALTFPVQSICFAVVCLAAIMDQDGTKPSYRNLLRASRRIRVYGDDIIVSKRYAHQCVAWLHDVGLQVNNKKSFLEGNFKESCGVDAFRGVDITPQYIKHQPDFTVASPSMLAGFVSLSNHMWLDGLYETATWLAEGVEDAIGKRLPLVSASSGVFGWVSRKDSMTPHKWCRRTHQFLTRTFALKALKRADKLDGYPALLKCLLQMRESGTLNENQIRVAQGKSERNLFPEPLALDQDHLNKTVMRYNSLMCKRWVPTLVRDGLNLEPIV